MQRNRGRKKVFFEGKKEPLTPMFILFRAQWFAWVTKGVSVPRECRIFVVRNRGDDVCSLGRARERKGKG